MPLVSIIIPTRDRCDLLRRCIDSIERHTPEVRYQIIVMDNGSTEESSLQFLDSIASRHRNDDAHHAVHRSCLDDRAARPLGRALAPSLRRPLVVSPGRLPPLWGNGRLSSAPFTGRPAQRFRPALEGG